MRCERAGSEQSLLVNSGELPHGITALKHGARSAARLRCAPVECCSAVLCAPGGSVLRAPASATRWCEVSTAVTVARLGSPGTAPSPLLQLPHGL